MGAIKLRERISTFWSSALAHLHSHKEYTLLRNRIFYLYIGPSHVDYINGHSS